MWGEALSCKSETVKSTGPLTDSNGTQGSGAQVLDSAWLLLWTLPCPICVTSGMGLSLSGHGMLLCKIGIIGFPQTGQL